MSVVRQRFFYASGWSDSCGDGGGGGGFLDLLASLYSEAPLLITIDCHCLWQQGLRSRVRVVKGGATAQGDGFVNGALGFCFTEQYLSVSDYQGRLRLKQQQQQP
jgi:hypothetical protein